MTESDYIKELQQGSYALMGIHSFYDDKLFKIQLIFCIPHFAVRDETQKYCEKNLQTEGQSVFIQVLYTWL